MKTINKLTTKLKDNKGESIAEVLLAVLVASLAMVALLTMITTSNTILGTSTEAYTERMSERNFFEQMLSWFGTGKSADEAGVTKPETVTETDNGYKVNVEAVASEGETPVIDIGVGGFTMDVDLFETTTNYNGKPYYIFCMD